MGSACEPRDQRPGLWLSGEVSEQPTADCGSGAEFAEILVETRTWYGIPHSVTTACVDYRGALYVPSVYFEGGEFPAERYWNRNVARDSRVRIKIHDRLHERNAVLVTDPAERAGVLQVFAERSAFWKEMLEQPESERPTLILMRLDPR